MGSLMPPEDFTPPTNSSTPRRPAAIPVFAQLYIYDEQPQLRHRLSNAARTFRSNDNPDDGFLLPNLLTQLQAMVMQHNPLAQLFKHAASLDDPRSRSLQVTMTANDVPDGRRYNLPTTSDIGGIIPDNTATTRSPFRDIVLRLRGGGLRSINELHALYDAYAYPLLFPFGEEGWHPDLKHRRTGK